MGLASEVFDIKEDENGFNFNMCARNSYEAKLFKHKIEAGFDHQALLDWVEQVKERKAQHDIKSEERSDGDEFVGKVGMTKIVGTNFESRSGCRRHGTHGSF